MKTILKLTLLVFALAGCSLLPGQTKKPSPPPKSVYSISESTLTSIPTTAATANPEDLTSVIAQLPEIPAGFVWKSIPEDSLFVLVPEGWFFKQEYREDVDLETVYVTKENIEETGRFSTGLSVFVFKDFKDAEESEQFAQNIIKKQAGLPTTKEILKVWDTQSGNFTIHHLQIRAEYPYETAVNQKKIVYYSTVATDNSVYFVVFESPEAISEEIANDYGIILDYVVIYQ
jgi:hypothetical protein